MKKKAKKSTERDIYDKMAQWVRDGLTLNVIVKQGKSLSKIRYVKPDKPYRCLCRYAVPSLMETFINSCFARRGGYIDNVFSSMKRYDKFFKLKIAAVYNTYGGLLYEESTRRKSK